MQKSINQAINILVSVLITFIVVDFMKPNPIVGLASVLPLAIFILMVMMGAKAAIVAALYYQKLKGKNMISFMHYAWAEFMDGSVFISRASREAAAEAAFSSVLEDEAEAQ